MASLYAFGPGQPKPRAYQVYKRITVVGAGPDDDLTLEEPLLEDSKLNLVFDGRRFSAEMAGRPLEFVHNGKKKRRQDLEDGDTLRVGETMLLFRATDLQAAPEAEPGAGGGVEQLKRLAGLSEQVAGEARLEAVLQVLMDALIEMVGADKGFVILTSGDRPWVKVARNIAGHDLPDEHTVYSDSILKRVLESGEPVVVSDALSDARFSSSTSVMNLKLCSVLAAPLRFKGQTMGLLYLGNDNVKNLFSHEDVEVISILAAHAAAILHNALLMNELRGRVDDLEKRAEGARFGELIGACPSMQRVYQRVEKVAPTDVSVLIQGETGSGKELIAREIHRRSARSRGPFVAINCGAIPENLLESELFGHMRGSFTGAVTTQPGRFHAANGGTLFLDEIGELPVPLQVKLLRVLQERKVMRVGATKPEDVDIRVIAATNKDLHAEVLAGAFREDLYYRLNVILVVLPPLRERGDDVLLLANYLLKRFAGEFARQVLGFSAEAVQAIRKYPWPGNIRELENRLKRSVIFCEGPLVGPNDLEISEDGVPGIQPLEHVRESFQMAYVLKVLELNAGNRTKTARDLDVDPRTVFRYLEREKEAGAPDMGWLRFFL
jgi:transcriptional regulator with GAF, ATPase, and Fis domain